MRRSSKHASALHACAVLASGFGLILAACRGDPAADATDRDAASDTDRDAASAAVGQLEATAKGISDADAASNAVGDVDATAQRAPWCTETLPDAGTPCTNAPRLPAGDGGIPAEGFYRACEYGSHPDCRTVAVCATGGDFRLSWAVLDPTCNGAPPSCPDSFDAASGASCSSLGTTCLYDGRQCWCERSDGGACGSQCGDAGAQLWSCDTWSMTAECPVPPPFLGTSCAQEGTLCHGWGEPYIVCVGGYWQGAIVGGP